MAMVIYRDVSKQNTFMAGRGQLFSGNELVKCFQQTNVTVKTIMLLIFVQRMTVWEENEENLLAINAPALIRVLADEFVVCIVV